MHTITIDNRPITYAVVPSWYMVRSGHAGLPNYAVTQVYTKVQCYNAELFGNGLVKAQS